MNGVKFIRENGGLGRTLASDDATSGLIVYGETAVEKALILSVEELEALGVSATSHPVLHYQVSEFFRINLGAKLYIQAVETSDQQYTEVKVLQNFAQGKIRQMAICDFKTASSNLQTCVKKLQSIAQELSQRITPLSILFSLKVQTSEMTSLPDLHTMESDKVSVVIGQDGGGRGHFVSSSIPSVSCIGAALGALSKAKVHESIAWVEKQNLVSTTYDKALTGDEWKALELDVPAFCDGSKNGDYTPQQLDSLNDKGYIFLTQYAGNAGTYFNDSFTASALNSDYAYIENNRTIDKAIREVNRVLVPKISAPAYIDADTGYLEAANVAALEALCDEPLDEMKRNGELSGYRVYIDPRQNVLQKSKLEVVIKVVPVGTLRQIEVKIGLTLNLNN
ncbi:DUF2586 family protein [Ornithobacterium rhinotracheale]|uniref:DUF2586 family protein n=1 Tax=Ornithobacterium rhinotracheale TaxID=28251 RepID=UPI00129C687B|nr:DUF2586 family protein [Ornithobacterium rhinotracheale]MRJ11529.1 DUF2586 family protein [Ornithobacterium rhinotracheale]